LRPFERRAATTRRPPFVAMRERNPWRRLRTSRLGWNVRFIVLTRFPRGRDWPHNQLNMRHHKCFRAFKGGQNVSAVTGCGRGYKRERGFQSSLKPLLHKACDWMYHTFVTIRVIVLKQGLCAAVNAKMYINTVETEPLSTPF